MPGKKVPAAVQSMLDRGLLVVGAGSPQMARAHFTFAGLEALLWLASQRSRVGPAQFAHIRRKSGLEAPQAGRQPRGDCSPSGPLASWMRREAWERHAAGCHA